MVPLAHFGVAGILVEREKRTSVANAIVNFTGLIVGVETPTYHLSLIGRVMVLFLAVIRCKI